MFSSAATSLLLKRDGEDITGNATAIAEACGGVEELDRMGLRVRSQTSPASALLFSLEISQTDHSDRLSLQIGMIFIVSLFIRPNPSPSDFFAHSPSSST